MPWVGPQKYEYGLGWTPPKYEYDLGWTSENMVSLYILRKYGRLVHRMPKLLIMFAKY